MSEVRNALKPKKKISYQHQPKRPRHTLQYEVQPDVQADVSAILGQVRGSISRWVKLQPTDKFHNLKENEHFGMGVFKSSNGLSVIVKCNACNKSIGLHKKDTNSTYQISNWTRHIKTCKKFRKTEKHIQKPLGMFISITNHDSKGTFDTVVTSDSSCKTSSSELSDDTVKHTTIKIDQPVTSFEQPVFQKAPPLKPVQ